jgi:hypothetical protein
VDTTGNARSGPDQLSYRKRHRLLEYQSAEEDDNHMTAEQSLTEFWAIVEACLVEIYGMPDEAAAKAVRSLWSRGAKGVRVVPSIRSLFYHSDPIHIAMNIAGDEIPSDALWERYEQLLRRHKYSQWNPAMTGKRYARAAKPVRHARQTTDEKVLAGR